MSRGRRRLPGDRRPSSHRTTPPQGAHRQRLQLFPDMGLRFPKCYSPSEGTAGEPLGRSPGQGAGSCRAAPEVAGAAVQSSTRRQGRAAASLSRPRAPRTITRTGRWGRRLRGTALRAPPRGPTSRARGSPSAAAPQVRCLGQVIFFPGPQCPRLQIGNETASTLTQLRDDGQQTSSHATWPTTRQQGLQLSPLCRRGSVPPGRLLAFSSRLMSLACGCPSSRAPRLV